MCIEEQSKKATHRKDKVFIHYISNKRLTFKVYKKIPALMTKQLVLKNQLAMSWIHTFPMTYK